MNTRIHQFILRNNTLIILLKYQLFGAKKCEERENMENFLSFSTRSDNKDISSALFWTLQNILTTYKSTSVNRCRNRDQVITIQWIEKDPCRGASANWNLFWQC